MKRKLIALTVVLLIAVAFGIWQHGRATSKEPLPKTVASQPSANQNVVPTPHEMKPTPASKKSAGPYELWHGGQSKDLSDPRWEVVHAREKVDPKWEGKMPIEFYGKVLDEREQPIVGATVEFRWTDLSNEGSSQRKTTSDASGLFSLSGVQGKYLGVEVKKEGYYVDPGNRYGYEYAGFWDKAFFEPDPNAPVIFHLRKKGEAEPLIHHEKLFGFKPDGTAYYIDLKAGRKITNGGAAGDLLVRLVRSETSNNQKFDWSLTIQGVGQSGITESQNGFLFDAPVTGYQNVLQIEQKQESPDYQREARLQCYVRLADGKTYGRIEANVLPKYNNDAAIDLKIYVNPSGSRNLEFDPAKQINPH